MNTEHAIGHHYVFDNSYVFEVHDSTIQALYGLGLKLEDCISLMGESPEQAKAGIDGAIVTIGKLIDHIRQLMQD